MAVNTSDPSHCIRWPLLEGGQTWRFPQAKILASLFLFLAGVFLLLGIAPQSTASQVTMNEISYSTLPGDQVRISLGMSAPVAEPLSFAIDKPARIALDFSDVRLNLKSKTQAIGVGVAESVTAVEAGGRTRVVINLARLVPYETRVEGSNVYITLNSPYPAKDTGLTRRVSREQTRPVTSRGAVRPSGPSIENIDFRRGPAGEGRIVVTLSHETTVVNTFEQAGKIVVEFLDVALPENLARRLDVIDFATPVQFVDTFARNRDVRMVIESTGLYDHLAYQSERVFTVDIKPMTKEEQEAVRKEQFGYTGERLSLNFQNVEVRAILQLIAEFTGLNIVASDTVSGSLTLRLKNVPWDQAMDIILKTKGLAKRQTGNVILVAPTEEIAAREKLELEAQKQIEELAPLKTEFVQVNYAKAADIAALLKAESNSLLSERGNVTVDERTNTLLVRDTADNLAAVRGMVGQLDIPVRQVLIESRIVIADDTFTRELGVNFGFSRNAKYDDTGRYIIGGKLPGDVEYGDAEGEAVTTAFSTDDKENFIVALPIGGPAGSLGFSIGKLGSHLLHLELQALQAEGRGEVLSNPRVITSNQKEASIEQGVEIPYQEATSSGATSTSFKKAVLSLKVTPQITPDDRIIMDLAVNQDTQGENTPGGPAINTRAVTTQVLVDNGETVVLGGIYEQTQRDDVRKVPFFGDLPYVGFAFRSRQRQNDKSELLIFVTPKILASAAQSLP